MAIDIKTFSPKDAKVLRENKGVSPYELVSSGLLSEKAYKRLLEDPDIDFGDPKKEPKELVLEVEETPKQSVPKPIIQEVAPRFKPVLSKPTTVKKVNKAHKDSVWVLNKRTGKHILMARSSAQRLAKYPNEYTIIS